MPKKKQQKEATNKPVSRRDNFSKNVIQILRERVGGNCCRCYASTFGPNSHNPSKSVNIGKAAHIAAASPDGPRYDPKMTREERVSTTNGMWMCSNCHDIIDRDVEEYPTVRLKKMKKDAEENAKETIGVATNKRNKVSDGPGSVIVSVSAVTITDIRKAKAEISATNEDMLDETQAEEFLKAVNYIDPIADHYLVEVARELTAFYDQLVARCKEPIIVLDIIRALKILSITFHAQWTREDVEAMCTVIEHVVEGAEVKNQVYISGIALLKDLSKYSVLKDRKLHVIPIQSLQGFKSDLPNRKGRDLTDGEGANLTDGAEFPPSVKRACLDFGSPEAAGGPPPLIQDTYIELMEQLSVCENAEKAREIEEQLVEMGYEPEVY